MKPLVNIIVENEGFLIKNPMNFDCIKIMPKNIYKIPNIPFYHSLWAYEGTLIKPNITELQDCITNAYGKLSKLTPMVACPADSLPVDIRLLEETFEICGLPNPKLISKSSLLALNGVPHYISISASERLVILEWYNNREPIETRYYSKSAVNKNKLLTDINNIRYKQQGGNINIFIFDGCNELKELYELGECINANQMMELLQKAGNSIFSSGK
ncbi:MAG: hypothetical protein K6G26_11230 [Lachnospiraceae bacterium]|nr:hypothetical protein [Lachnospiraceae bacterium]